MKWWPAILKPWLPSIDHEIARLQELKAHRQRAAAGLRDRVMRFMMDTGIERVFAPRFTISIRQNPERVVIFDDRQIPLEYMSQPSSTRTGAE